MGCSGGSCFCFFTVRVSVGVPWLVSGVSVLFSFAVPVCSGSFSMVCFGGTVPAICCAVLCCESV